MKYFGLSSLEAAKKLNEDFRLRLEIGRGAQCASADHANYIKDKNLTERFKEWEKWAFDILSRRFREIHERSKVILTPNDPNLQNHISDLAEQLFIEWLLDMMIENMRDFKRQIEFYRDYKEVVARYDS